MLSFSVLYLKNKKNTPSIKEIFSPISFYILFFLKEKDVQSKVTKWQFPNIFDQSIWGQTVSQEIDTNEKQ